MIDHRTRVIPTLSVLPFALATALATIAMGSTGSATSCALASAGHHAALVAQHGDGTTVKFCVAFASDKVTGGQLLEGARAQHGLEYQVAYYSSQGGNAVCQVDNEPATPQGGFDKNNCLGYPYWAIYCASANPGNPPCHPGTGMDWATAGSGVDGIDLYDGDALGFHWESAPLRPPSPAGICPAAQPDRTPTPAPTNAASSRPSAAVPTHPASAGNSSIAAVTSASPAASETSPSAAGEPRQATVRQPSPQSRSSGTPGLIAAAAGVGLLGTLLALPWLRRLTR